MTIKPTAIVIRFDSNEDGIAARHIMKSLGTAFPVGTEAWMCVEDSLDMLNETLTVLGWPPRGKDET